MATCKKCNGEFKIINEKVYTQISMLDPCDNLVKIKIAKCKKCNRTIEVKTKQLYFLSLVHPIHYCKVKEVKN